MLWYSLTFLSESLSDRVNVILVRRVDLTIFTQTFQYLFENLTTLYTVLYHIPDVTFMDELVSLLELSHDIENELLAVNSGSHLSSCIHIRGTRHSRCSCTLSILLTRKRIVWEDSLLADAVSYKHLKEMICDLIHFINFLDVSANNCFLFLEDSDRSIYLDVHVLSKQGSEARASSVN